MHKKIKEYLPKNGLKNTINGEFYGEIAQK